MAIEHLYMLLQHDSAALLAEKLAMLKESSIISGAVGAYFTLVVPVGVWVGVFAAMGAPYAEAREAVRNENFQSGFSQGFVMGALNWEWDHAKARFGRFGPGHMNRMDESLSYEGANAYNAGLKAGFVQARSLSDEAKKAILTRVKSNARGASAGNWNRLDQIAYVVELAAAARRNNIFKLD